MTLTKVPYSELSSFLSALSSCYRSGGNVFKVFSTINILPRRTHKKCLSLLEEGNALSDSLRPLMPSIASEDLEFIEASNRWGSIEQGLDFISEKYRYLYELREAYSSTFVYPVGIVMIGVFLYNAQACLYGIVDLRSSIINGVISMLLIMTTYKIVNALSRRRFVLLPSMSVLLFWARSKTRKMDVSRTCWMIHKAIDNNLIKSIYSLNLIAAVHTHHGRLIMNSFHDYLESEYSNQKSLRRINKILLKNGGMKLVSSDLYSLSNEFRANASHIHSRTKAYIHSENLSKHITLVLFTPLFVIILLLMLRAALHREYFDLYKFITQ